jgi:hypothetical protein
LLCIDNGEITPEKLKQWPLNIKFFVPLYPVDFCSYQRRKEFRSEANNEEQLFGFQSHIAGFMAVAAEQQLYEYALSAEH